MTVIRPSDEQTVSVKAGIALLGKRVRKPKGQPLFVEGNVAICAAVSSNGFVDLVCQCCRQPAGTYSPLDLEQAP
jgi:hypothetical protein